MHLEKECKEKLRVLVPKLDLLFEVYEIISAKKSKEIVYNTDKWPKDKWSAGLYLQTKLTESKIIDEVILRMNKFFTGEWIYLGMMNFDLGLLKISKNDFTKHWRNLIDIDNDEISCYNPYSTEFLCIEKTKSFIKGKEDQGILWIYEVTYSNADLKQKLHTIHY